MARATTTTLIPLDRVAHTLQIDPLHFNTVICERRPQRNIDDVWLQHNWQKAGKLSREDLAMALHQAESILARHMGFPPVSQWIVEEEHQITRPANIEMWSATGRNLRGARKSIRSTFGHVIETGRRAAVAIEEDAAVVYSDPDGDSYDELATVSVVTAITDVEEIQVFYPDKNADPAWQIRPISVSCSAGVATITFPKYLAVLEDLQEKLTSLDDPQMAVDGDDNTNFLLTVDVYRVYNDPSQPAVFYSETICESCSGAGCDECGHQLDTGCLLIRDARLGILAYAPATWNATDEKFDSGSFSSGMEPEKIMIWYRAGYQDKGLSTPLITMDPTLERMLVFYALTFLDTDPTGTEETKRIFSYQRTDLARNTQGKDSFALAARHLDNPLGTTRAAIRLWEYITQSMRLVTSR